MTTGLIKRIGRIWATLLVAYALVLTSLVPAVAAPGPGPDGLVICTLAGADDGGAPAGDRDHLRLCCVLCQLPALPEGHHADRLPAPPLRAGLAGVALVAPDAGPARPSPATTPQAPRPPPQRT